MFRHLKSLGRGLLAVRSFTERAADAGEQRLTKLLKDAIQPSEVVVEDISGGCGSMYRVNVVSPAFEGKRTLQQHQMVLNVLRGEVTNMHGLTVSTAVPKK